MLRKNAVFVRREGLFCVGLVLILMFLFVGKMKAEVIYLPSVKTYYVREDVGGYIVENGKWIKLIRTEIKRNKKGLITSYKEYYYDGEIHETKFKYTYKDGKIIKVEQYHDGELYEKETYSYTGKNKLYKKVYNGKNKLRKAREFIFRKNKLTSINHYKKGKVYSTIPYSWKNGKLWKITATGGIGGIELTTTFEYSGSKLKKVTYTQPPVDNAGKMIEVYTYNGKGLLKNKRIVSYHIDGTLDDTTDFAYEYKEWYKNKYPKDIIENNWVRRRYTSYKKYEYSSDNVIANMVYDLYRHYIDYIDIMAINWLYLW